MDKQQRNDLVFKYYRRRLKNWMKHLTIVLDNNGEELSNPTLTDLMEIKAQYKLKNSGKLCSCYCCSGYFKYRRHEQKVINRNLIEEFYEEF